MNFSFSISTLASYFQFYKKTIPIVEKQDFCDEKIFNFPSLPWVCQKRFAEICDAKTLKTFASINSSTRNLSKRCHYVKKARIDDGSLARYHVKCFCSPQEYCKGVDASQLQRKFEVLDSLEMHNHIDMEEPDVRFFQQMPVSFASNEKLILTVFIIKLKVFKTLIKPNLKSMVFVGRIIFECPINDILAFFESLSKLDHFMMTLLFDRNINRQEFISCLKSLQQRMIIDTFSADEYHVKIKKNF